MGVRGAKQEDEGIEWIDSSIDYVEEGKAKLDEGTTEKNITLASFICLGICSYNISSICMFRVLLGRYTDVSK